MIQRRHEVRNYKGLEMNTLVVKDDIAIDILVNETESIIAETENVYELITEMEMNTSVLESLDFDLIRSSAEELQSLVLQYADDYTTNSLKGEIVDESITLYQNCKYILSEIEDEYSSIMTDEVAKTFSYIRASVNTIRDIVDKM